jgi:hypothetical protein
MSSVVVELQRDALNRSFPVSDLLRKALVVSKKLSIGEFEIWLTNELNGYGEGQDVPKYRLVHGEIKGWNPYHGWQPVYFEDTAIAEKLSIRACSQTIAEIESLIGRGQKSKTLQMPFPKELEMKLMRSMNVQTQVTIIVQESDLVRILDAVRTIVLNWALKLEEDGVKGEELTFTSEEKKSAEKGSYNINNFFGPVHAPHIQQQTENSIQISSTNIINLESVQTFIATLKANVPQLSLQQEQASELNSEIETVESQTKSPKPKPGIIREALGSIGRILEGAGGTIAAQLIIELGKLMAG